jgi:hypothetical protein
MNGHGVELATLAISARSREPAAAAALVGSAEQSVIEVARRLLGIAGKAL